MSILIVDATSITGKFTPYVGEQVAGLLLLRLVYKVKMKQHPDSVVILSNSKSIPFNNIQYTFDPLDTVRKSNVDLSQVTILSANPEFLALREYCALAYRVDATWLEPVEIGFARLKVEVGHDPRDFEWFRQEGIVNPERRDKAAAGRLRREQWAWTANRDNNELGNLRPTADNIHIKVGRTGFSNFEVIQSVPDLLRLLDQSSELGWDTETTGLNPRRDSIVGESFSIDGVKGYYLPILHDSEGKFRNVSWQEVIDRVHPVIATKKIYGANLAFDVLHTVDDGMGFPTDLHDIQGYAYMLGMHVPDTRRLGLKSMAREILNDEMEEFSAVTKGAMFNEIPIEKGAPYAADDAVKSFKLAKTLWPRLTPEQQTRYNEIEKRFLLVCIRMSYNGMYLNMSKLTPLLNTFSVQLENLQAAIFNHAGEQFNIGSGQQLQRILFDKLGLPPVRRTKTGYSTDKGTLEALRQSHPIIELIIEYSELNTLINKYLSKYPDYIANDGRIHSSINPFFVITGRINSRNPNLMNIPIRTAVGRQIRELFEGQYGNLLLSADAGQLEYRVLAHYSNNPRLLEAFRDPTRDIHKEMASLIFDIPVENISSEQRDTAKTCFYAILYGAEVQRVAATIKESLSYASGVIKRIRDNIPEIGALREAVLEEARRLGYVETHEGHRVYINGLHSPNSTVRATAERSAFDGLFQGTGSGDITKMACITAQDELDKLYPDLFNPKARLIMQVHDEILVESDEETLKQIAPILEASFVNSVKLSVPLTADTHIGKNWGNIH